MGLRQEDYLSDKKQNALACGNRAFFIQLTYGIALRSTDPFPNLPPFYKKSIS